MKKCFLLIACILLIFCVYGQVAEIDSLLSELSREPHDTTEVLILCKVASHEGLGDFPRAKAYAFKALKKSEAMEFEKGIGKAHFALGLTYDLTFVLDSAVHHYLLAKEVFEQLGDKKGEGNVYTGLGYVYLAKADYGKAVENALIGLKKREEVGLLHEVAGSYMLLGNIFYDESGFNSKSNESNLRKALWYHEQSLQIYEEENDKAHIGKSLTNIANAYSRMGMVDSALIMHKRALAISQETGNKREVAICYNNLGYHFLKLDVYDSASHYLMRADSMYLDMGLSQGRLQALRNISRVYKEMGNFQKYLEYARKSYLMAKEVNAKVELLTSTNLLHDAYARVDSFQQAYRFLKLFKSYSDTIYDNERVEQMRDMELSYNVEKKEQQIAALEQEKELTNLRRNIWMGSVGFIALIGFLLYNQQRIKSRRNLLLLEKEQEVDRMKSRFFANISHEFRTPLTLLIGPIEEVRKMTVDKKALIFLDMMKNNTSRLLNQVNQLLDLSKLDSGQLELKITRLDVVPFIRGVVMSFESLAASRAIDLQFHSEEERVEVYCDPDAMERIVINLVSNALKFTKSGDNVEVKIRKVSESRMIPRQEVFELVVEDTGAGFDQEVQNRIFERYFHTESDMQASTGIGLALVKELVESHRGNIQAVGERGHGSVFTIHLPLGKEHLGDVKIHQEPYAGEIHREVLSDYDDTESISGENEKHILIIEDNEDVRLFIRKVVEDQFRVTGAPDGKSGVEEAREHLPDLIVTDIMMPGMNGYEVTRELKNDMKTSHIPVIMLTAKAGLESKLEGLETEADDYMTKPFEATEFLARVNNLIRSREKLREQFGQQITLKPNNVVINSMDAAFIDKVMGIIETHLADTDLSVEFLGEQIGMSRSQVYRKLHAITGHSPKKIIRDIRLDRAMDLLKNNAGTISEIAYMTGFSSPNYFTTCFHQKFGYSPGELKKITNHE